MYAALLVDRPADPRAIAGKNRPQIGKLRAGAVTFDQFGEAQPAAPLAPRTGYLSSIVILSAMLPNVTVPLRLISFICPVAITATLVEG